MNCAVCSHVNRVKIEQALIERNWSDGTRTYDEIGKEFGISGRDLQVHAVMHFAKVEVEDDRPGSITDKIKLREADLLVATMNEYYATLKNVGGKLNRLVGSTDPTAIKFITSAMVDLYLGTGRNIKECTETMIKLNVAINGEENKGLDALAGLVTALNSSIDKIPDADNEEDDD